MRLRLLSTTIAAAAVAVGLITAPAAAAPALAGGCAAPAPGYAQCYVTYQPRTRAEAATGPSGWGATDLEAAYTLPVTQNSTALVAVSIAYDAPNLEQDLNTYRSYYHLGACTAADGCLTKVNQTGAAGPLPPTDVNWQVEETLDVSMISAACPHCRILVVEGDSASYADLAATEDTAVRLGAQVVSNSYGGVETGQSGAYTADYTHPGHTVVVSSGDSGYGQAHFPASVASVTSVGGTVLAKASTARGWSETAWQDGSSGCSAYVAKPSWQHDPHCPTRTIADVSAVGENVAIYNTLAGGWLPVSGTSVSAPLVAGIYGLAGNATTIKPGYAYQHTSGLFDVTSGTNDVSGEKGGACGSDYLCVAGPGYDAPTGLGTPDGTAAF
jgi:subtilase family serine protease